MCFKPETMLRIIAQVKREGYNFAILPSFGLAHVRIILLRVLNVLMGLEAKDRWLDATTVLHLSLNISSSNISFRISLKFNDCAILIYDLIKFV